MKKTDLPARKPVPFAANGSRRDLTDKTPTGSNQASYDAGFPPVTMVIKAAGGLPPDGRDFNQAFNELYAGLRWQNAGGGYPFDADFAAAISGYPAGVKLPNSTSDGFWLNTLDGNTNNPEVKDSTLTGWVPVNNYGTSSVTGLTTGTVTLSTLQASKNEIALSGTLTGNITLIVPAWQRSFNVTNNCQGNFTVSIKTSTGTGLVMSSGRNNLYCDGKNITAVLPVASLTNAGITQLSSATNSDAENVAATPKAVKDALANAVNRQQKFTASGSFTVPTGVTTIYLSGCAAGGGGASGATNSGGKSSLVGGGGGGGGGAGQSIIKQAFTVTPGQVLTISIGAAGNGAQASTAGGGYNGNNGGNTSVTGLVTLLGGSGGGAGGVVDNDYVGGGGAGGDGGEGYPAGSSGSDGNYAGNGGPGASSTFGGGGGASRAVKSNPEGKDYQGQPAFGFGAGGGGSGGAYGATDALFSYSAGDGAPGLMIVEW
ncbi:Phage tail fibre repeat-containing protein [Izhakiella capsodis]|uniref:Phage tail fibre repeat-containing protein n=1 Tax=Izhakiella capsodis TaxID=1367852 RepID=A0A1I4XXE6_9GAMM|nr:phage tail protein [Izhakiella capsodis]SFN29909.1 Phage tail fibre repeat-containing protein [Izhakiella capsodis]